MFWIVGVFVLYLLVIYAIAWISLHPFRIPAYLSPTSLGAVHEDIEIESDGNRLRGWWVGAPDAKAVMICFHGYMMNRCELAPEACAMWQQGISCLILDHRAHGRSGGGKCFLGVRERIDVAAAVQEARRRAPNAKIGLMGSSMGAAACAFALGEDPTLADLMVLDSAYGKLSGAIQGWWYFIGGKFLMTLLSPAVVLCAPMVGFNPFEVRVSDSLKKLSDQPVLLMHGRQDVLASADQAQENFDAIPGPKTIVWFEGCNHSEGRWEQSPKYREALFQFLGEHGFIDIPNKQ